MKRIEEQYFFLHPQRGEVLFIAPDQATDARPYLGAELLPGPPLRFLDAQANDPNAEPEPRAITDVLHGPGVIAFHNRLRLRLEEFELVGMRFYPMVLEDAGGNKHNEYWLLNVFEEQPFVDLKKSELLDEEDPDDPEDDGVVVLQFAFDERAMKAVPEDKRLVFRPAHVMNAALVFHERIVNMLHQENATGFRAFRVSEFHEGMQF